MTNPREELLSKVIAAASADGFASKSLREIADEIGSSHRMLNYHFGGREGLIAAVVEATEADQRAVLRTLGDDATDPADVISRQWEVLTDASMTPLIRLFFEIFAQAIFDRPGTAGFLDGLTEPWLDVATEVGDRLDVEVDRAELRLGVAVMRGLLMEVLASGETAPATESLDRYLSMWDAARNS